MANGGFFFTNLLSFFSPISLSVQTPPELQAYGWTTTDLWCAPLATGLYALLTHAQPFWIDIHGLFAGLLGETQPVKPLDPEVARAVCFLLLSTLFVGRTVKNFGLWKKPYVKSGEFDLVNVKCKANINVLVFYKSKPRSNRC